MTKGAHCFSEVNERLLCVMKFDCCSSFHSVIAVVMAATSRIGVLMKLDKNQRKPRVFKASDLCPYYNRIVDPSDNAGCFHNSIFSFTVCFLPAVILFANIARLCAERFGSNWAFFALVVDFSYPYAYSAPSPQNKRFQFCKIYCNFPDDML